MIIFETKENQNNIWQTATSKRIVVYPSVYKMLLILGIQIHVASQCVGLPLRAPEPRAQFPYPRQITGTYRISYQSVVKTTYIRTIRSKEIGIATGSSCSFKI